MQRALARQHEDEIPEILLRWAVSTGLALVAFEAFRRGSREPTRLTFLDDERYRDGQGVERCVSSA